jgi:6-pyruvoyl tetrahydropterin synthase/QueD family protein
MMTHRICKTFHFEAAHQLKSAVSKACVECIHGHNYVVEVCIESVGVLNGDDMVLDFTVLKRWWEGGVGSTWDHALILHEDVREAFLPLMEQGVLSTKKVVWFTRNPTAEVMAETLWRSLSNFLRDTLLVFLDQRPRVVWVRVHETPGAWAEFGDSQT